MYEDAHSVRVSNKVRSKGTVNPTPNRESHPVTLSELSDRIDTLIEKVNELEEAIIASLVTKTGQPVIASEDVIDPDLFVPVLSLMKENVISARTICALDSAGIKYISDFLYVTLSDVSSIRGIADGQLSELLRLLESRFKIYLTGSKKVYPELHTDDLVKFIPTNSKNIVSDQALIIANVDHSALLPKYACVAQGDEAHLYFLSPSVLAKWIS